MEIKIRGGFLCTDSDKIQLIDNKGNRQFYFDLYDESAKINQEEFNMFQIIKTILEKPLKKLTEINFIMEYLSKFKDLMNLLKSHTSNFTDLLYYLSIKIKIQNLPSNQVVFRYGERTDKFYIIFKGTVSVLLPVEFKIELSEDEYFIYLATLRKNYEIELINILLNRNYYPIKDKIFELWLRNQNQMIQKFSKQSFTIMESSEIYNPIGLKGSEDKGSIENYIEITKPKRFSIYDYCKRKEIIVFTFKEIKKLFEGDKFGDFGFSNLTQKR